MKYDIAVIGGGPGGYTAAEAAAKEGFSVVLFEQDALGGTCLNRGCMPTKALLHTMETYTAITRAADLGILVSQPQIHWDALQARKNQVVLSLRQGVEKRMKAKKITVVKGAAQITGPGQILCGGEDFEASDIIIATGSRCSLPPIPGIDLPGVCTSNELLEENGRDFQSLVIIGGGVVGVECASIYLAKGAQVTILDAADHLLPAMDREIAQRLTAFLKKQGAFITTKAAVQKIEQQAEGLTVTYTDKKGTLLSVTAQGVLVSTGRKANTEGLFAPGTKPEMLGSAILADRDGRTSIPHLYVIGDAMANNVQLAHVAAAQGVNTAAILAGKEPPVNLSVIPACVYTSPEIASVGMTEDQAKAAGIAVLTRKQLTGANGKCLIEGSESGYVKLVADGESGRLLGAQLVCPRATDLIGELALAVQKGLTLKDITATIHPHPTFCEMIYEAADMI